MASKTKTGAWRISYTMERYRRREISLSSEIDKSLAEEFERLVKSLVRSRRYGVRLSDRDAKAVENLPLELRRKLAEEGFIAPSKEERIPTLSVLLEQYRATRSGLNEETKLHDKRIFNYLNEYFGNVRIDLIAPAKAAGIRGYLQSDRRCGRGTLGKTSTNRAITSFRSIFSFAVQCGYLKFSPFDKVRGGKTTNPERQDYITEARLMEVAEVCENSELAGILGFARFAGLRIPCEIRNLRFSDFDTETNLFNVHQSGKTGFRQIPIFTELKYFLETLRPNAPSPENDFLFPRYRNCANIAEMIKKRMRKAGLAIWEKFFLNLRSSCITDKERLGFSKSVMNAIFGNSEAIRLGHYVQPLPDTEYGQLDFAGKNTTEQVRNVAGSEALQRASAGNPTNSSANFADDVRLVLWKNIAAMPSEVATDYGQFCGGRPTLENLAGFLMLEGFMGYGEEPPIVSREKTVELDADLAIEKAIDDWESSMAFEGMTGRYGTRTCDP